MPSPRVPTLFVLPAGILALCAAPAVAQDGVEQAAEAEVEEQQSPQSPRGLDFRPWKKNFFLASWDLRSDDSRAQAKFQVSLRSRLIDWGPAGEQWSLDFGYTGLALWDVFSTDSEADYFPADHSPEVFLETPVVDRHWLFRFSPFQHHSNGERGADSRSWNRWYVEAIWNSHVDERTPRFFFDPEVGAGWRVGLKVWDGYSVASQNEDIEDYYGNFELNADLYSNSWARSVLTLAYRDSGVFAGDARHTLRVEYGFDLSEDVRLSLQWFSGYGDYLLRYDEHVQRIGIGIEIAP